MGKFQPLRIVLIFVPTNVMAGAQNYVRNYATTNVTAPFHILNYASTNETARTKS